MPEPSSWSWGAVYRVVLGLCVGATKWQLQPYYPTKAGKETELVLPYPELPRISEYPCALRPSFLLFSLFYTLRLGKRGGWYGSWGGSLLHMPYRPVRGYKKHIFINVSLNKKSKLSKRLMKWDHLKWHPFPLGALWILLRASWFPDRPHSPPAFESRSDRVGK